MNNSKFCGPVFLIGLPRSGTKLLRELLNRHPLIFINNIETEFLPYFVNNWELFGDLSNFEQFQSFYTCITRLPYFIYRTDARIVSVHDWYEACSEYTPAAVFEALSRLDMNVPLNGNYLWGDKSPSYIHHLSLIKGLYPRARFIHIIRDVRDYCLSINKAWGKNILRAAQRWTEGIEAARNAGIDLTDDYLELHYEDLVMKTEPTLRRICVFLNVSFNPKMLTLNKPSENIGDATGVTHIKSDNLGKFSKAMNLRTLTKIEAIAGSALVDCGYKLALPSQPPMKLSMYELRKAQICDAINFLRYEQRQRGFFGAIRFFMALRSINMANRK